MWNSRRLRGALQHIQGVCADARARHDALTPEAAEGNDDIFVCVQLQLMRMTTDFWARFKHLAEPPWSFAHVDTQAGAAAFMRQLRSVPFEQHEPETQWLARVFGGDIEAVAQGGPPSEALLWEVKVVADMAMLDESAGEGVHRSHAHEHGRAAASSIRHTKQSSRHRASLRETQAFRQAYGERARRVLRHDWRTWKRVLQCVPKYRWRPKKNMTTRQVFDRVYREDDEAVVDWSSITTRVAANRAVVTEPVHSRDQLSSEYINAIVHRGQHYSIETTAPATGAEGQAEQTPVIKRMFVIDKVYAQSRPHLVHTASSADDPMMTAHLGLCVRFEEAKLLPAEAAAAAEVPGDSRVHVYGVGDPVWLRPSEISDFQGFYKFLWKWDAGPSEHDCCLALTNKRRALCHLPLQDRNCPVMTICNELRHRGWVGIEEHQTHTALAPKVFDAMPAMKMRSYYQVLLRLLECLPLTSALPSRECVMFYKLLLAGVTVEPGLPNKEYLRLAKQVDLKKPGLAILDGEEEHPAEPVDDGLDGIVSVSHKAAPPKAKPRAKGASSSGVGRPVAKKAAGPGTVDPVPIELPPPVMPPPLPPPPPAPPKPGGPAPPPPAPVERDGLEGIVSAPRRPEHDPAPGPPRPREPGIWFDGLPGTSVSFKPYNPPDRKAKPYVEWKIKCARPGCAAGCMKKRSVTPGHTALFGEIEPLAYLNAWLGTPAKENKTHQATNPSDASVAAVAQAHGEAIRHVIAQVPA